MSKAHPHKDYIKAKRAFLDGKPCARCGVTRQPLDVHHSAGRAGGLLLNSTLWVALCRGCHNWVHLHPKLAIEAGFNAPRGCWNDEKRALRALAERSKVDV